jgi:general secretion pathway protein J
MIKRAREQEEAGYTLLEMMVALVVFGLVMAGIAQTFRFGTTAWSAAAQNTTEPEALVAVDDAMTRMIKQILPGTMTGLPDQFAFTTILPSGAGIPGGLADAAIMVSPDGDLVLRFKPHPPGIPLAQRDAPETERLVQGVTSLSISYLVSQSNGPPAWSNSWQGDGLPLLVKIHLQFSNGRNWPDLVAAPIGAGN